MRTGTCGVADVEAGVAVVDADVAVGDGVDVVEGSTSSAMSRWVALRRSSKMVCSCPWTKTVKNK